MIVGRGEGGADGVAPGFGAEGVSELVLGERKSLDEGLAEIGERGSGFGVDVALGDGSEEAREGGRDVAGGDILTGEVMGDFTGSVVAGEGLGLLAGMMGAKVRMTWRARHAAAAAVGESEGAEGRTSFGRTRGHYGLL